MPSEIRRAFLYGVFNRNKKSKAFALDFAVYFAGTISIQ